MHFRYRFRDRKGLALHMRALCILGLPTLAATRASLTILTWLMVGHSHAPLLLWSQAKVSQWGAKITSALPSKYSFSSLVDSIVDVCWLGNGPLLYARSVPLQRRTKISSATQ